MLVLDDTKIEIAQARKGISAMDLVKLSGLTPQTIKNAKKGFKCKPETVHAICKALECDPTEIVYKAPWEEED
jgi:DNA-binding Xre family transcriptional regulator